MDLTPKQQTSEAIRQAESILILTGQHPSVDQSTAVIALTMILRKFGKQVAAVVSDSLPAATSILDTSMVERSLGGSRDFILKLNTTKAEIDQLRYEPAEGAVNVIITPARGSFAPSDVTFDYGDAQAQYDLAIVLGVPARARIDRVYEQNAALFSQVPVLNIDFHRSNENYGAVNLIDPNASSLCEILVALSESLQGGIIEADMATALLMGIVASTDRFTAAHTTSKSLTVAAQMMAAGAKQPAVVRALYRGGDRNDRGDRPSERSDRNNDRPAPRDNRDIGNRNGTGQDGRRDTSEQPRRDEPRRDNTESRRDSRPLSRPAGNAGSAAVQASQSAPADLPSSDTSNEPAGAEAPSAPKVPNPDAARDQNSAAELPIIAPGHIEPSAPLAPTPELSPVSSVAPAASVAVPAVLAPQPSGQLPAEMSPLASMSLPRVPQPQPEPSVSPLATQQLQRDDD